MSKTARSTRLQTHLESSCPPISQTKEIGSQNATSHVTSVLAVM
jgi:hypothetical protein